MKKKLSRIERSYQVYVDLDELIMSRDCSPSYLEDNFCVPDQVLYDAISYSTCANWMLKLDYLCAFSSEFRKRIYESIHAFSTIHRAYFLFQMEEMSDGWLRNEYKEMYPYSRFDDSMKLHNPMNNLSNRWKEKEKKLLEGSLNLHEMLHSSIKELISTGNKEVVDFSYSLFFPEILSPKFFSEAEDCERVVILGMYESYVDTLNSFSSSRFGNPMSSGITIKKELNPLIALVRHVLFDSEYSDRVRTLAWNKMVSSFMKRAIRSRKHHLNYTSPEILPIDATVLDLKIENAMKLANGFEYNDLCDWIRNAEETFEPFELDCASHGLNSSDFIWLLVRLNEWSMVDGLLAFQDNETRSKMMSEFATVLEPISMH